MTVRLERTRDPGLIKRIFTRADCFAEIADDGAPAIDAWTPIDPEIVLYLAVYEGEAALGLFMLVPRNLVLYELHTVMLPVARGRITRPAAHEMFAYLARETACRCLLTMTPDANPRALACALAVGFTVLGRLPDAFRRAGVHQGMTLLYRLIGDS